MSTVSIDALKVARMFLQGSQNLESKKDWINQLNVFPVPDGDTGTNMTMTIMSAAGEVSKCDQTDMAAVCKAISSGSLRGARGNSGVILSQLLRGFTKVAAEHDTLDVQILADAFDKSVETAYKAVMKPKEGTILTVAKGACDKARELASAGETDLEVFAQKVLEYAEEVLAATPDMLPVLKQAGVVDSGGQGLVEVLRGACDCINGRELVITAPAADVAPKAPAKMVEKSAPTEIKFGYCTEFVILLKHELNSKQESDFRTFLGDIGDSIVMVADDEICKIHVHTNDPGLAIQKALMLGQLSNMKVDNMRMEHREKLFHMNKDGKADEIDQEISGMAERTIPQTAENEWPDGNISLSGKHVEAVLNDAAKWEDDKGEAFGSLEAAQEPVEDAKDFGIVTVCAGDGLAEIFRGLGADYVISGGQTMNPSTDDILSAIEKVNARTVFVFPNNKNIIMAANQARDLTEDKTVIVIPTKTVPQGITAAINFIPDMSAEENEEVMLDAISGVRTGEVTYAVRDTMIDDREIHSGDYMGIGDDGIAAVGTDIQDVTFEMLESMVSAETELISVYYGSDVDEVEAARLRDRIEEKFTSCDIELQCGGQPVYYYIVSAE
ncbi:DAK2 domain-containing protein [Butyrivibrio sp. MC2013]|uniref:DAK2 domain-containing protein n=1 Tax=Butyrivibrio sp. MC2013 TaxID=1280686 RepID=UPI0004241C8A|nr:DAK2 domain-containing protein [Butyrivibrio sp. MC2013]